MSEILFSVKASCDLLGLDADNLVRENAAECRSVVSKAFRNYVMAHKHSAKAVSGLGTGSFPFSV